MRLLQFSLVLLLFVPWARAQDAVYVLKAGEDEKLRRETPLSTENEQVFELHRNLIFFTARLNGQPGNFILDTGAPNLLVNSRSEISPQTLTSGQAAGGEVPMRYQKVASLEFNGQVIDNRWALALDLRPMEARTGRKIDGFVGYHLLRRQELRIDYEQRKFSLRKPDRKPLHEGRAPDFVGQLRFVDHLPVISLKVDNISLRFILDTGAGVNLIDPRYRESGQPLATEVNVQGFDGNAENHQSVQIQLDKFDLDEQQATFVLMDLTHLQTPEEPPVAGILGAAFLSRYVVGVDYRKQKLYLWYPETRENNKFLK